MLRKLTERGSSIADRWQIWEFVKGGEQLLGGSGGMPLCENSENRGVLWLFKALFTTSGFLAKPSNCHFFLSFHSLNLTLD